MPPILKLIIGGLNKYSQKARPEFCSYKIDQEAFGIPIDKRVLQAGVVLTALFTAAAQPNEKACNVWWSPFFLSALASFAAIGAVLSKLSILSVLEEQLLEEKEDSKILFKSIQQLRRQGVQFDVNRIPKRSKPQEACSLLIKALQRLEVLENLWVVLSNSDHDQRSDTMCWKQKSPSIEIVQLPENERPQKGTVIHNETDGTIVLRDINRYAWRYDRLELKPGEKQVLILKAPCTFFQMGAIKKVDENEEKLNLYIDADQLVDGKQISICYSEEEGKCILKEKQTS
eukprot:Gb_35608 [translate_table: standard]